MAKVEASVPARSLVRIPYTSRHHGRDLGPFSIVFTVQTTEPKDILRVALEEFFAYQRRSFHTAILYPHYDGIALALAGGRFLPVPRESIEAVQSVLGEMGN